MATNFFFDQLENDAEQELLADLIEESIQIHGHDVIYIVRTLLDYDPLYGADDQSLYQDTYDCEMYIKSVHGFGSDKDFLNQFGANIRDEVVFSVSARAFNTNVGQPAKSYIDVNGAVQPFVRPREGDLIYFPLNKKCFKITFVDSREMFYQLGSLYTFELTCELFEYSGEKFNTSIPEIDDIYKLSTNIVDSALQTDDGDILTTDDGDTIVDSYDLEKNDPAAQNDFFKDDFDSFVDWSEVDPFSEGNVT
jgi:hypothetical protein